MKIAGRSLYFSCPVPVDIIIFDECNESIVRKALNPELSVGVFKQRPEDIWLGLGVIYTFFKLLPLMKWNEVKMHPSGTLRGILRQLKLIYFLACLLVVKPKAVITMIDNSSTFGWLARHCRKFPFIGIQNGGRLSYAISEEPPVFHQHLFCFGRHEMDLLPANGWQVEHFYPVGSLVASLHFHDIDNRFPVIYDLLVVSSWRGNIGFQQDVQDTMRSMKVMDELLATYIRSRKITAAVILRAERGGEHWYIPEIGKTEEEYYKNIYGGEINIIETNFNVRNIFPLIEQSKVIVACLTTALMEALGIGKKVLYFNFTGTDSYHRDFHPDLVFTDSNKDAFFKEMDDLLNMPSEKYQEKTGELQKYYMNFKSEIPTSTEIALKVDEIIGKDHHCYEQ